MVIWFFLLSLFIHSFLFFPINKNSNEITPLIQKGSHALVNYIVLKKTQNIKKELKRKNKNSKQIKKPIVGSVSGNINHEFIPVYPELALMEGIEGRVILNVKIKKSGTVESVQLKNSSGYEILDESALNQVKLAKFSGESGQFDLEVNFIIN